MRTFLPNNFFSFGNIGLSNQLLKASESNQPDLVLRKQQYFGPLSIHVFQVLVALYKLKDGSNSQAALLQIIKEVLGFDKLPTFSGYLMPRRHITLLFLGSSVKLVSSRIRYVFCR